MSPLPPVRSGIADYVVDLLPSLAARAEVRLVRLPGQPVEPEIEARWTVLSPGALSPDALSPDALSPDARPQRVRLYQMGNNEHHLEVWRLAMETPGVLVLHDLFLHHFLVERTLARDGALDAYREALTADHGWLGDSVARTARWPGAGSNTGRFVLPARRHLLSRQRGVLVHSAWAAETLREEMPALRVRQLRMGVPLPEAADDEAGRAFRARHGLPLDAPIVGSFGFQTPIKRTQVALEALRHPAMGRLESSRSEPDRDDVHLMIVGEVSPHLPLEEMAAEAGLADRVHVLGYLPFDEMQAAIAAADVCLNLRYPTAGETSASLLRILAVGRPAVVSEHAQMADLPRAGLIHVPLGDGEVEALASRLAPLLADRDASRRLGAEARRFVERHHRVEDAAQAVADACADWARAEPLDDRSPVTRPPTSFVGAPLDVDRGLRVDVEGVETPWPAGRRRRLRIRLRNRGEVLWLAGERPDGGVALQVALLAGDEDLRADAPWLGLPFDLEPGGEVEWELELRRPASADAALEVRAHIAARAELCVFDETVPGVPFWRRAI